MYDIDIDTLRKPLCVDPADLEPPPGLATTSGNVGQCTTDSAGAPAGGQHGRVAAAAGRTPSTQAYWRNRFTSEACYETGRDFEDYAPAYELGSRSRALATGEKDFDAATADLQRAWESGRADSSLTWEQARAVMRAAWHRVDVDLGDANPDPGGRLRGSARG